MAVLVRILPTLKAKLSEIAEREHRSLSRQVEFFLERCVEVREDKSGEAGTSLESHKKQNLAAPRKSAR